MRARALAALFVAVAGCSDGALQVTSVDPAVASSLDPTAVVVHGHGFHAAVHTAIDDSKSVVVDDGFVVTLAGASALTDIARVDDTTLTATVPAGVAPGLYDVAVTSPAGDHATLPGALRVQAPPTLSASAAMMPVSISAGQDFTLVVTVGNGGDASALAVTPAPPTATGTGAAELVDSPAAADIAGGASADFAFHYHAVGAGDLTLATSASGADAGGHPFTSNVASASTTIETAPVLTASASASPSVVSVGQTLTLTLTVANQGQSTASAVTPSDPVPSGSGAATKLGGPSPADVGPGAQATFTWTYAAAAVGTLSWTFDGAGTDPGGHPVAFPTASAGPITIEQPVLAATLSATPAVLSTGQTITLTMSVINNGNATVNGVLPTMPSLSGGGSASVTSAPATPATLGPGGSAMFVWSYTATVAGSLSFTSSASGSDANSGATVTSAPATSTAIVVQAAAALVAAVSVAPSTAKKPLSAPGQPVDAAREKVAWPVSTASDPTAKPGAWFSGSEEPDRMMSAGARAAPPPP
ncbi:MAG TPA: IPT/TIG domain-containing protein, partial [Polyangia bacterium]